MDRVESSFSTLEDIKKIMNRSTVFLSLSGWSGIMAGTICLLASGIAYQWIYASSPTAIDEYVEANTLIDVYRIHIVRNLLALAIATFLLVFIAVFLNTRSKAVREHKKIWDPAAQKMATALFIPILAGALFILGLMKNNALHLVAPASLVFYGLGLVSTSKFTFTDIKYLGYIDILLGLAAMFFPQYGLVAWAMGFGILHIIYGLLMFKKAAR